MIMVPGHKLTAAPPTSSLILLPETQLYHSSFDNRLFISDQNQNQKQLDVAGFNNTVSSTATSNSSNSTSASSSSTSTSSWLQLGPPQQQQQQQQQQPLEGAPSLMLDLNLGAPSSSLHHHHHPPPPITTTPNFYYNHPRFSSWGLLDQLNYYPTTTPFFVSPSDFKLVHPPPPTISLSGLWFSLLPSLPQSREPFLPPLSKSFLRIKDGRMTVRLVIKYVAKKLGLENESQVEIRCRGQVVEPFLTLQHVRDHIWSPSHAVTLLPNSSTSPHLMLLHYGRTTTTTTTPSST